MKKRWLNIHGTSIDKITIQNFKVKYSNVFCFNVKFKILDPQYIINLHSTNIIFFKIYADLNMKTVQSNLVNLTFDNPTYLT